MIARSAIDHCGQFCAKMTARSPRCSPAWISHDASASTRAPTSLYVSVCQAPFVFQAMAGRCED